MTGRRCVHPWHDYRVLEHFWEGQKGYLHLCFGSGRGIPCGKTGPMLTQFIQATPLSFSGEHCDPPPLFTAPDTLSCFLFPRGHSDSQGSRPIGCQTLVEALENPELVGREGSISLLRGLVGSH